MNSIVMNMSYGYDVQKEGDDPLVDMAGAASHDFEHLLVPNNHILNFMPWRRSSGVLPMLLAN